ncbi:N-acetylmuramoyl-L-alanine amidase family protein [Paenibacillus alginolyticus]|uniref:N-acetylmuramoyl-L-alanine amidase n=1 Tax=Paenibacillus alginolyticus TaxID=59839 RepID=A0ABT4GI85_9BACL|nr:N-acetylmuramoyl-L-alanine amidase [Paenibacillus alginolyticus]MCY9695925.1 N-acetylmuramoyl-L-alanine amidase [Paenibacillus alginolyticus]MEC0146777.1 N-acetylmuramoyl-L-alanine amidase [Paenibacillus alginolyticus]
MAFMIVAIWIVCVLVAAGCTPQVLDRQAILQESPIVNKETPAVTSSATMQPVAGSSVADTLQKSAAGTEPIAKAAAGAGTETIAKATSEAAIKSIAKPRTESVASKTAATPQKGKLVMLDPGHQRYGNNAPESVGPDSRETKPKVSSGTVGVRTKKPEYVLNLEVSLLIKDELVRRGIEVAMTRESHDVDISNKQRADMANEAGAALAVRIHADGDSSPKTKGFSVLYPSTSTAAVKPIAAESHQAAGLILEHLKAATDTAGRGLSARSDLSGFNWSKVPVVLVELGFMTNPEEDELMSEAEYQKKLAQGIADGIEHFLKSR